MAIEALGLSPVSSTTGTAGSLNLDDFVRILVSQLNNQDPLKPMDNQEFVAQLAQFTSLEQTRQLNANIESLLQIQSTTQSVGLIGKTVQISTANGTVTGQVSQLSFSSGEPRLSLRTAAGEVLSDIHLSQLLSVQ